jgi:hypothetical protein
LLKGSLEAGSVEWAIARRYISKNPFKVSTVMCGGRRPGVTLTECARVYRGSEEKSDKEPSKSKQTKNVLLDAKRKLQMINLKCNARYARALSLMF